MKALLSFPAVSSPVRQESKIRKGRKGVCLDAVSHPSNLGSEKENIVSQMIDSIVLSSSTVLPIPNERADKGRYG